MTPENPPAGPAVRGEATPEHVAVFQRFRRVFGDASSTSRDARRRAKREPGSSAPFGEGRDPKGIAEVVDALTARLGWNSPLARSELLSSWQDIVGAETAVHSAPVGIEDGVLTVSCDSTAWATQLRLMRSQILTQVSRRYPDAGIRTLRFDGPGVPSWKRGRRSIPGRGPRDTYG
ncbi:MAG TPA: DciA family protein [Terrimesophilobacter sp.]|nr:DciA family protein [Terrimesophilobacter sp.]